MADRTHPHDTSTPTMSAESVPSEDLARRAVAQLEFHGANSGVGYSPGILFRYGRSSSLFVSELDASTLSASHLAKEGGEAWAVEAAYREDHGDALLSSMDVDTAWDASTAKADLASHSQPSPALAKGGDAVREALEREGRESYEIGKRDGYEEAVQHIDQRTGGDGEYCCVVGYDADDRHCPDPQSMIARIVERFEALSTPTEGPASQTEGMGGDALREALDRVDFSEIDALFQRIPSGPYQADARGEGWEVRQIDTDPTNKHHWPFRLCNSIQGQKAACDDAIFPFIAAILNVWPTLLAALTPPETAEAVPVGDATKAALEVVDDVIAATSSGSDTIGFLMELHAIAKKAVAVRAATTASDPAPATDDRERLVEANHRLMNLLYLADEALMELHGCFPNDEVTEEQRRLKQTCKAIRALTGEDYLNRKGRAAVARAALATEASR